MVCAATGDHVDVPSGLLPGARWMPMVGVGKDFFVFKGFATGSLIGF